jgi:hypothetical protein
VVAQLFAAVMVGAEVVTVAPPVVYPPPDATSLLKFEYWAWLVAAMFPMSDTVRRAILKVSVPHFTFPADMLLNADM